MPLTRTEELRGLAVRVADALPPVVEEVVLTGSVSRGVADVRDHAGACSYSSGSLHHSGCVWVCG
jgi:hypothetical protein